MAGAHPEQVNYLKGKIRLFEDDKISAQDLSKEVYFVARELFDPAETIFRRNLETLGNRIAVAAERDKMRTSRTQIMDLVDQLHSELIEQGY
jgi:hypothetical protein